MFIARREAKCSRLRRSRAGQLVFSQRQTASSSSRSSVVPQIGQVVGITHGCGASAPVGRRSTIDFTTLGMTSPAFSIRT